jgi:arylformamidase
MSLPAVRGRLAISSIYDLEPIRLNYLNDKLGLDEVEAERIGQPRARDSVFQP